MKNNKKIMTVLLTGALITGVALSPALASKGFKDCNRNDSSFHQEKRAERMEYRLEKMTTMLDLTATQQGQIKEILADKMDDRQDMRQQRCEDREQMQKIKTAATFDEAAFRAQAEKRAAKRIDMQVERMQTKQKIFALLTAEQQEKAEILFQTMGKRGHGHERGMKL